MNVVAEDSVLRAGSEAEHEQLQKASQMLVDAMLGPVEEQPYAATAMVRVVMVIVERMIHRHGVDVDELGALMGAVLDDLRGNEAATVDYAGRA